MRELISTIPDANALLAQEPEELASILLLLMRRRGDQKFLLEGAIHELWGTSNAPQYAKEREYQVNMAIIEAWAWLEAQGLLIPDQGTNGRNGWRLLSRRARRIETQADFSGFRLARSLPKENLHPRIADEVWLAFMRGNFDVAVFLAMKAVEVTVREAARIPKERIGVNLMRDAFSPENGPLTDPQADGGERVGRMDLFAAAVACYKNPQSHRDVNLSDPQTAIEIIYLANHLLKIVDQHLPKEKRWVNMSHHTRGG